MGNQVSMNSSPDQSSELTAYQEQAGLWVDTEFASADLGDGRLEKRLISIIKSFCQTPDASIPQATGSWKKTKAAYRFLNNEKITHEKVLTPHQQTTQGRINGQKIVLAIQDTTTLNYTHHPQTRDLGSIGTDPNLRGMLVHTTLAITPKRVPLGIIHQQSWERPIEEYGKKHHRHKKDIKDKESQKWLNSFEATEQVQKHSPATLLINIGDRESDIYELFQKATRSDCHLLVRAAWNRRVSHPEKYLWAHLEAQPLSATLEVNVARKAKKAERTALVELRFAVLTLKPPRRNPTLPPITISAIYVNEPSPPKDEEPLCWMLLTTLPVVSCEDAIKYVGYYAIRFTVELFHKVLKSGCKIEKRQLKTADTLRRCLAIDSIVAWRIMFLTMLGRAVPNLPCTVILEEHEWKSLYCFVNKTQQPPAAVPSLQEATRLIARLGGFLGRKHDRHPGAQVLWRGMQKLSVISVAWKAFGPELPQTSNSP